MKVSSSFPVIVSLIILAIAISSCPSKVTNFTVYTIGDSTMADKKPEVYPETGWCQAFPDFLTKNVTLRNHAVNGRSTKSFIDEGRWQNVADSLKSGDFVFIQFGHNDQKIEDSKRYAAPFTTYKTNLERFISETLKKDATPILFTSIIRRKFKDNGQLIDTHGDYPKVVRQVAEEMNVALIDLEKLTAKAVQQMGDESSKKIYLWTDPTGRFSEGRKDDTHLSSEGAAFISKLVAEEFNHLNHPLSKYLK